MRRFFGIALAVFGFASISLADEREKFFDEKFMPFVREMQWPPHRAEIQNLSELLREFEALKQPKKEIASLDPMWLRQKLSEMGIRKAVIGLCGDELPPCEEVEQKLQRLTSQCSGIYLGTIDVEKHPATPRDLYDTDDPTFIMLMALEPNSRILSRIGIMGTTHPGTVALVMCPEEKLKHIFRVPAF